MTVIEKITEKIATSQNITILTGAGVSTASGIPDFRSTNGLWAEDESREYYISRSYFFANPEDFWHKYKQIFRVKLLKDYEPNLVHRFLQALERKGKNITIITQNVDGLHERAGNQAIIEYHGNLNTATCPSCGATYSLTHILKQSIPTCNQVGCGDILKPDIVLFGDPITQHERAEQAIRTSDYVMVMGTSLLVSPFNLLPSIAFQSNIPMALLNREATPYDDIFDCIIHDDLLKIVENLKNELK
ncbi:NAD-dependent protein deacylase [Paraliobacillus ryukyuensis]|uniref:NAD-dependent protein deacylase n=1 Tax=Paraliobacillus ryukyuensis TaxID=200904 RepID=UPI0009A79187|nr:NAD-dependent protein deacylase [Paraliobacillus ryukyuensis]